MNIIGKVLAGINDMDTKANSCVKTEQGLTAFCSCNIGCGRAKMCLHFFSRTLFLNYIRSFFSQSVNGFKLPHGIAREYDYTCFRFSSIFRLLLIF